MNEDLGTTAHEACASLAKHYADPIHYSSSLPSPSGDIDANDDVLRSNDTNANHGQTAPYFDDTLGGPMPDLAPVCGFWYRRLLEVSAQADTSASGVQEGASLSLDAAQELLCCYKSTIHPIINRRKVPSPNPNDEDNRVEGEVSLNAKVEIIRNYELLLAHFMRDASSKSTKGESGMKKECRNLVEVVSGMGMGLSSNSIEDELLTSDELPESVSNKISELNVGRMIHIISDDIFQWSSINLPKKGTPELWKVQNVILPCLLRLIEHSVRILTTSQNRVIDIDSSMNNTQKMREDLSVATVTAVSFVGDGKLKSGVFGLGSLLDWILESTSDGQRDASARPAHYLSLAHTLRSCSPTEEINRAHTLPASIVSSDFMTRSVIDWSVPAARFGAPWTDGVTGIGSRVAMSLLHRIQQSTQCIAPSSLDQVEVKESSLQLLLRKISQRIGTDLLVSTIRAHFFGRLPHHCSPDADKKVHSQAGGVFMPMVKRFGDNDSNRATGVVASSDEKPHIEMPMRMSAAAILLCAALPQPEDNVETWDKAFSDALPIAMTLLDDVRSINQAIGALILLAVIQAAFSLELKAIPSFVKTFGRMITTSLESAIQMCSRGEPTILTIICLAQSKWIRYLELYSSNKNNAISTSEVSTLARKAASDILIAISKQVQSGGRDDNDERIAGVLVAGINPLLAQLADLPEAASVEIARIGLSTLLSLVGWSGMRLETRAVQISALVGLVSLMNGAYPIMPHHGKKIMTEIFLLLDRADKDAVFLSNEENDDDELSTAATSEISLYAAGVALAVCGKGAESILEHVESTQLSRKPLLDRCLGIRDVSEQMKSSVH